MAEQQKSGTQKAARGAQVVGGIVKIATGIASQNYAQAILSDEVYKAQRYLSQCELSVIDINDNGQLIDLLYGFINKQSSKYVRPGNFADGMFDEVHTRNS